MNPSVPNTLWPHYSDRTGRFVKRLGASVHGPCRLCGEDHEVNMAKILLHAGKEATLKSRPMHKLARKISWQVARASDF